MLTNFFSIMNSNAAVKSQFGTTPLRIFPYGTKMGLNPIKPYALYGLFNSVPYNYLSGRTDMDLSGIQVDIYADNATQASQCFGAIRTAVELQAHVTSFDTPNIDIEDGLYHVRMEIDFHDER